MPTDLSWGDEVVTLVQIDQDFCELEYSVSPCQAALGGGIEKKCYNTRFTCQDPDNYDRGTLALTLGQAVEGIEAYDNAIPTIQSVRLNPLQVNLNALDRSSEPFGRREVLTITCRDFAYNDHLVDKYRTERIDAHGQTGVDGFRPENQGTFWGKWKARNPYYEGFRVRLYTGKMGETLANLRARTYYLYRVSGPNANGEVTLVAKDLLYKVEDKKAVAPLASLGRLDADINDSVTTATLAPTGIGDIDYPASGRVAIGDEVMDFTRAGDTLTLTRGALNTTAEAHDEEDSVQIVLSYEAEQANDIVSDLILNYTDIEAGQVPTYTWETEANNYLTNLYTGHITEPTKVRKLIGELSQQAGFVTWPDTENDEIKLKAINSNLVGTKTVTDDDWIKADTLSVKDQPEQRVSRVFINYALKTPTLDQEDPLSYLSRVVVADLEAEGEDQYGQKALVEIFSRWIPSGGRSFATDIGERLIAMFRDPPFRCAFELHGTRAGELRLGEPFTLNTRQIQNDLGGNLVSQQLPISIERYSDREVITCQRLNFSDGDVSVDGQITSPSDARQIFIDNDTNNFNLRTLHDSLFAAPLGGETVICYIAPGAIVGSDDNTQFAFDTGDWPSGVTLKLVHQVAGADVGEIIGGGGRGRDGGSDASGFDGEDGEDGGDAVKVRYAITIDMNNSGRIAGAGGGGAGGAGGCDLSSANGGAGGGGAGTRGLVNNAQPGGGPPGVGGYENQLSCAAPRLGNYGTLENGGDTTYPLRPFSDATKGGRGGDLAQAGENGSDYTNPNTLESGNGGLGGSPGNAVDGVSLVTYVNKGTVLGAEIN